MGEQEIIRGSGPHQFWTSPFGEAFLEKVGRIRHSLFIISPYIRMDAVERVVGRLRSNPVFPHLDIKILTRHDEGAFLGGHSHAEALLHLLDLGGNGSPKVEMRWLPNLHAKVYVFDDESALVTSANLTADSFFKEGSAGDIECGVLLESKEAVQALLLYLREVWTKAAPALPEMLRHLGGTVCDQGAN